MLELFDYLSKLSGLQRVSPYQDLHSVHIVDSQIFSAETLVPTDVWDEN